MMSTIPYSDLFEKTILIRSFEEKLLDFFSKGKLSGTTHTYVGQEAIAVSAINNLHEDDVVFSNHRCHGHYLSKENDPKGLMAEILGLDTGPCGGRGGSQHICRGNFYSNGIQGGYLPNALGMAYAEKYLKTDSIVVAFIGDGTLGEGTVYETLNLAALWKVPLLIVVENNQYAQTTNILDNLSGSIVGRARSFGVNADEITSNDISVLYPLFKDVVAEVRKEKRPFFQVVNTYRLNAHSKGDDFRDCNEIEEWRKKDPLLYFNDVLSDEEKNIIKLRVDDRLLTIEQELFSV